MIRENGAWNEMMWSRVVMMRPLLNPGWAVHRNRGGGKKEINVIRKRKFLHPEHFP
jgi:hypothetical protein